MTPDWSAIPAPVPYANLTNPQTLNLYAIVHDNPETFADLDGHYAASDPTIFPQFDLDGRLIQNEGYQVAAHQGAPQNRNESFFGKIFGKVGSWFTGAFNAAAIPFMRWGRLGGPAHRAELARQQSALEEQGYKVDREVYIRTPNGAKSGRFVDLRAVKDGETRYIQVGRQNQNGTPVAREVVAADDIEAASGIRPSFAPYNNPEPSPVSPVDGPLEPELPVRPEIPIDPIP